MLIFDLCFFALAVIVGCLPSFKSLFRGHRSPQRYNSSVNGKNLSLGLRLNVIRHGSAETGDSARPIAGEQRGEQQGSDHGCGGGYQVPPGAIGVTNDYVSCSLGA